MFSPVGTRMLSASAPAFLNQVELDVSSLPRGLYLVVARENGLIAAEEKLVLR